MNSDFARLLNAAGIQARQGKVSPAHLVDLVRLIDEGRISGKIAKDLLAEAFETGRTPSDLVPRSGKVVVSDVDALTAWCREAIAENPDALAKYNSGQPAVAGFLMGQAMKKSDARADPVLLKETLTKMLEGS